jgi:murein L,D-transpeptidase YcbB/YkuD
VSASDNPLIGSCGEKSIGRFLRSAVIYRLALSCREVYAQKMENRQLTAKKIGYWLLIGALVGAVSLPFAVSAEENGFPDATTAALQSLLKTRLADSRSETAITVQDRTLASAMMVRLFYARRDYRSAWVSAGGSVRRVEGLLTALQQLRAEALVPEAYHLESLRRLHHDSQSNGLLREEIRLALQVDLELLATDAFFTSAGHLLGGRVAPETLGPEQQAVHKDADLIGALEAAVGSGRVQPVLKSFLPNHEGYRRMRRALERYRRIEGEGEWPQIPDGIPLRAGRDDARVSGLRRRLAVEGYLDRKQVRSGNRFDATVKKAVRVFQRDHGLAADGVVGPQARQALNVSAAGRIRQIELNMERWRWLPRYLGKRYLLVNIADYRMEIVEGDRRVMVMRVAVGRDYRRTPVFSAELNQIVLNPHWYVPATIFAEDLLPAIRVNPEYLQQRGYKVFSHLGPNAEEVDPDRIDWQTVTPENFDYILRKDPGPYNPMGRAKFLFPNRYEVYIHDSPDRSIFSQPKRTFSSGCIRIENPIELAEYLLKDSSRWPRRRILSEIESGRPKVIAEFDPLPIHIQYWTVWVEENGQVQFRDDIYGRDALLQEVLFKGQDF